MRKLQANQIILSNIWTTGICHNHNGKMEGMTSISTSCRNNTFCEKMSKIEGTICQKCYAQRQLKAYAKTMMPKYEKSTQELTSRILTWNELPIFDNSVNIVRVESFGELNNTIQAINYINIIRKNPFINFGWWTKRPNLIARALKEMGLTAEALDNCNVIYSNPYIDTMPKIHKYPFIKGYFTVWSSEEKALENGQLINCGKKKCKECLNCYDLHEEGIFFINELLK